VRSADGQVQGIDFPQATAQGAAQNYLIGAVIGSQNADLADSWIRFVTGPQGDAALTRAGFQRR
jgi:molybdate transport system substrate-binding protein